MVIYNNSIEQINIALLEIEDKIKRISNANEIKSIKANVESILRTLNETTRGLESGATYNINITGNASTASRADYATTAESATNSDVSNKATNDGNGNNIATTYQNVSQKNGVAGYASCNKSANGNYVLTAIVNNGNVVYDWISN